MEETIISQEGMQTENAAALLLPYGIIGCFVCTGCFLQY